MAGDTDRTDGAEGASERSSGSDAGGWRGTLAKKTGAMAVGIVAAGVLAKMLRRRRGGDEQ